jgi:hypothetical protein
LLSQSHGNLTAVGNISQRISAILPRGQQALVPRIVTGLHDAIAAAVAQLFWLGVIAAVIAFFTVLLIREVPMRGSVIKAAESEVA